MDVAVLLPLVTPIPHVPLELADVVVHLQLGRIIRIREVIRHASHVVARVVVGVRRVAVDSRDRDRNTVIALLISDSDMADVLHQKEISHEQQFLGLRCDNGLSCD